MVAQSHGLRGDHCVHDILLDFLALQRFCWLVSPACLCLLQRRDSSASLPAFLVGPAMFRDYMLFYLLTCIMELLTVEIRGASPGPLLHPWCLSSTCFCSLIEVYRKYSSSFWGVFGLCDRQQHYAQGFYQAYSASFLLLFGGFIPWRISSLLLSWFGFCIIFWLQWASRFAESWRFELPFLDAAGGKS